MNKRHAAAVALFVVGFILCYGTIGHSELYDVWTSLHTLKVTIGTLLLFASVPVWGDAECDDADCTDVDEDEQTGGEENEDHGQVGGS